MDKFDQIISNLKFVGQGHGETREVSGRLDKVESTVEELKGAIDKVERTAEAMKGATVKILNILQNK